MATVLRTRLYREFLTPALHRRFTTAAGVTLLVCYAEAILIGDKSSLIWSWFPLGRAGIRTLLLFIPCLTIFILRVAQLHIGARTTASPSQTLRQYFFRFNTLQTLVFYLFSAWWFSEVYVWSQSTGANLNWVAEGKSYERPRLNERPIYLRSIFLTLALMQSILHLYLDYDRLLLPVTKTKPETASEQRPHTVVMPLTQLKTRLPRLVQRSLPRALSIIILGPVVYSLFLRRTAWSWSLFLAKIFWSLARSSEPPKIPPYHISILFRSVTSSFLLIFLWEISNAAFEAYVAQEPLKNDRPLTDDSRDPNGSLLTGLKAKKEVPKTFAFWELIYVSQRIPARRKLFFEDIDRKGGAMWTQVLIACLDVIQSMNTRIAEFQNPSAAAPPPQPQQNNIQSLPRISAPLKQGNIFTNPLPPSSRREMAQTTIGNLTKSYGQSQPTKPFSISESPRAKKYLESGKNKILTPQQQQALSPAGLQETFNSYLMQFLRSPFGQPFRQTLHRRACVVVLGTPYSNLSIIVDAIDSLTRLAICSLTEDSYGRVQADVPVVIRTFVNTIANLEAFKQNLPVHWTDVEFREQDGARRIEEVDLVISGLRSGLRELVEAFGGYADNLGLGVREMRIARETAAVHDGNES
ncbi:MAG: hypothetical protein M1830_010584 [Pleopsidium flavum]|nr:MAG: hypothetical protein M1830_010584 [Pleopsidium flavum]